MRGLGSIPRIPDSKAAALNGPRARSSATPYFKTDGGRAAVAGRQGIRAEHPGSAARSGWKLQNALGINARGQIIGNGIHNGIRRGFLLTPRL